MDERVAEVVGVADQRPDALLADGALVVGRLLVRGELVVSQDLESQAGGEETDGDALYNGVVATDDLSLVVIRSSEGKRDNGLDQGLGKEDGKDGSIPEVGVLLGLLPTSIIRALLGLAASDGPACHAVEQTTAPQSDTGEQETFRAGEQGKGLTQGQAALDLAANS